MEKRAHQPAHSDLSVPRELAEESTPRQLSEEEHQAIVTDRVMRETASLRAENDTLKSQNGDLTSKLDIAESARQSAEQAKETAEAALVEYKAEQEQAKEIAARAEARVAKVREVASHLNDDFYTDERSSRWAAMDDAAFESYVKEIAAVSGTQAKTPATTTGEPPRETAMRGEHVKPKDEQRGHASNVLRMRREQKGA